MNTGGNMDDVKELATLAESAVSSKLFGVASREAALMIMLTGRSLGIDPVAAVGYVDAYWEMWDMPDEVVLGGRV